MLFAALGSWVPGEAGLRCQAVPLSPCAPYQLVTVGRGLRGCHVIVGSLQRELLDLLLMFHVVQVNNLEVGREQGEEKG